MRPLTWILNVLIAVSLGQSARAAQVCETQLRPSLTQSLILAAKNLIAKPSDPTDPTIARIRDELRVPVQIETLTREQIDLGEDLLRVRVVNGDVLQAVVIPSSLLKYSDAVIKGLDKIETQIRQIQELESLGARLEIREFTIYHLVFTIREIDPATTDPLLTWMRNRMRRHDLSFSFDSRRFVDQARREDACTYGNKIYADPCLLGNASLRGIIAHEIVHATNWVHFKRTQDGAKMIRFYPARSDRPLLNVPTSYARDLPTDEFEAWEIGESVGPGGALTAKAFALPFLEQIEWLNAARGRRQLAPPQFQHSGKRAYFVAVGEQEMIEEFQLPEGWDQKSEDELRPYISDTIERRLQQLQNYQKARGL